MIIPPAFFRSMSRDEFVEICKTGKLNRKMCRRLWAMEGRTDKPPHAMDVYLDREDVMREFPVVKQ